MLERSTCPPLLMLKHSACAQTHKHTCREQILQRYQGLFSVYICLFIFYIHALDFFFHCNSNKLTLSHCYISAYSLRCIYIQIQVRGAVQLPVSTPASSLHILHHLSLPTVSTIYILFKFYLLIHSFSQKLHLNIILDNA